MNNRPSHAAQGILPGIRLALICCLLLLSSLGSQAAPVSPGAAGFEVVKLPLDALSLPAGFAQAKPASDNPKMDAGLAELAAASQTWAAQALDLAQASSFRLAGTGCRSRSPRAPRARRA